MAKVARTIGGAIGRNYGTWINSWGAGHKVVKRAIDEQEELNRDGQEPRDAVWAVLDLEREKPRRQQAADAKKRAESNGVKAALSDPCYEVWTLLHLEDTGANFEDCRKVNDRVKQVWEKEFGQSSGSKAQVDFSRIIAQRREAAARAKQHRQNNDPSWTEVYRIIEDIESIVKGANTKSE